MGPEKRYVWVMRHRNGNIIVVATEALFHEVMSELAKADLDSSDRTVEVKYTAVEET